MSSFQIRGGIPLRGEVMVSGSKNSSLGLLAASMLLDGPCRFENMPRIADVEILIDICKHLGATIKYEDNDTIYVDPRTITTNKAVDSKSRSIRASYYLQGALLGRFGEAILSFPGGCDFGSRPIDLHKKGFEKLGVNVDIVGGIFHLKTDELKGNNIFLDQVSVGATINLMIGATKAKGMTVIENAAREPHIVDVANFLNVMGANIKGAGTDVIRIFGVPTLPGGKTYSVIPDQIEAGTFMIAAAMTDGDVRVSNLIPRHMEPLTAKMIDMGINVETGEDWIRIWKRPEDKIYSTTFKTMPYPGFPTDLQPQTTVLLCRALGLSKMFENVWDSRFQYVRELKKMGADITIADRVALINGPSQLSGAYVQARDLRGGAAMVIAGLAASGVTELSEIHIIERGYENFVQKLTDLGADIKVID